MKALVALLLTVACADPMAPDLLTVSSSCDREYVCVVTARMPGIHDYLFSMEGRTPTPQPGGDTTWATWAWERLMKAQQDSAVDTLKFANARMTRYLLHVQADGTHVAMPFDWTPR